MTRIKAQLGSPLDISKLVEKIDAARHHRQRSGSELPRGHDPERSRLDDAFDDLIDWARAHQTEAELTTLGTTPSSPDLEHGDLILVNGSPATVRDTRFHAPRSHEDSGLPQTQAAMEIVTGKGSHGAPSDGQAAPPG